MIASAEQRFSQVYVYDERKQILFTIQGELVGYTATTVSIRNNGSIRVYDEKGHFLYNH